MFEYMCHKMYISIIITARATYKCIFTSVYILQKRNYLLTLLKAELYPYPRLHRLVLLKVVAAVAVAKVDLKSWQCSTCALCYFPPY